MKTELYNAITQKENGARLAGRLIREGSLVAFPTETVYGLGANGLDAKAVLKIFEVKNRPADNPLIYHVASKSDAKKLWRDLPEKARVLMDAFWPGPLSLVYFKSERVPYEGTAGLDTVAVRMPDHKTALAFLREANVPVAAPSANPSGRPSPTTAKHVLNDLNGKIEVILDGGPCRVGLESTVLSLVGTPAILRPGGVTREMLEAVIGRVDVAASVLAPLKENEQAPSPGMRHKHYAPDAAVYVAYGAVKEAAQRIRRAYDAQSAEGKACVIFASAQTQGFYGGRRYVIIGDRAKPETFCANLFAALREYGAEADSIFTEALPEDELGLAYMNRLLRAAGFKTL